MWDVNYCFKLLSVPDLQRQCLKIYIFFFVYVIFLIEITNLRNVTPNQEPALLHVHRRKKGSFWQTCIFWSLSSKQLLLLAAQPLLLDVQPFLHTVQLLQLDVQPFLLTVQLLLLAVWPLLPDVQPLLLTVLTPEVVILHTVEQAK